MALTPGNRLAEAIAARRRVCAYLEVRFERLTVGEQVHGDDIVRVTEPMAGRGRYHREDRIAGVDGLVTTLPDAPLMVLGADCCLVAVFDRAGRGIGVVHAGWRGTAKSITAKLVSRVAALAGCAVTDLQAVVSPCARACCYEVGQDVVDAFEDAGVARTAFLRRDNTWYLDVQQANIEQLIAAGVPENAIESAGVCTICSDGYHSYRRTGNTARQHALVAAIRHVQV